MEAADSQIPGMRLAQAGSPARTELNAPTSRKYARCAILTTRTGNEAFPNART